MRRGAQDLLNKNLLNDSMLTRVIRYAIERGRLKRELQKSVSDLKESELRFSEMAQHIDHGIWIWSPHVDEATYQNPACDRIFGRTLEEWRDIEWSDVIHPDDREAEVARIMKCARSKIEYDSYFRIIHTDGRIRHLEQSTYPILDQNGDVDKVVGVCRDITDRKRLENELQLAQKLEAVGQLASGIAHEINTPSQYVSDNITFLNSSFEELAKVLGAYQTLVDWAEQSGMNNTEVNQYKELSANADLDYLLDEVPIALQQSMSGLDQIKKIVRAMKEFSHPSDDMEAVDINNSIQSTATVARNEWKYVAELEFELDPEMPTVVCIPSALNQVILNLIVNAAHAIAEIIDEANGQKGRISISTRVEGEHAVIAIADNGCGISEEVCDRIFDPFFTTKEVGKGTGQGLAIAHSVITERHNGSIHVTSQPGNGTTFTIHLPVDGQKQNRAGQAA